MTARGTRRRAGESVTVISTHSLRTVITQHLINLKDELTHRRGAEGSPAWTAASLLAARVAELHERVAEPPPDPFGETMETEPAPLVEIVTEIVALEGELAEVRKLSDA